MGHNLNNKSIKTIVRLPKQDRSRLTVEAILESAFQILETDGLPGFKVATLAERSGYSVGTLYQYFNNIDSVMLALVDAELERQRQTLLATFSDLAAQGVAQRTGDVIKVMMNAFSSRRVAQKAIIEWVLSRPEVRSIEGRNTFLGQILASVSARSQGLSFTRLLTPIEMFILSRSLLNTIRNAIWSDESMIDSPLFAQGLADLVDGFIHQLAKRDDKERKVQEVQRLSRRESHGLPPA